MPEGTLRFAPQHFATFAQGNIHSAWQAAGLEKNNKFGQLENISWLIKNIIGQKKKYLANYT